MKANAENIDDSFQLPDTGAVIVTFYPCITSLRSLVQLVSRNCMHCVIVDNTPEEHNDELSQFEGFFSNLKVIRLQKNLGIAKAQNLGVDCLRDHCSFFILFDQDSAPASGMIEALHNKFNELVMKGYKPGAVGPLIINKVTRQPYVARVKSGTYLKDEVRIKEMPQLMSSGTFFSKESWQTIGPLDENLFIDGVDLEWCWRGRKKNGYRFFVLDDTCLYHSIGEDKKLLGVFKIKAPAPERCYYLYRNYFYLIKRSYVPLYWKLSSGIKYIIKLLLFPLLLRPGKKYLSNIWRGIGAGFRPPVTTNK